MEKFGTIMLEGFLGVGPTLCVGESEQVKMQSHIVVQGILTNVEEPFVCGPGQDPVITPVKLPKDGVETVDLSLAHLFRDSGELPNALLKGI